MTEKNVHETIAGAIDAEPANAPTDSVTKRVLADLDEQGYVIVPAEQWSQLQGPVTISTEQDEQVKQSLREANAMVDAVLLTIQRRDKQLSVPKDELLATMREALRRTGRTETEVHDHHRAALEGRGQ